MKKIVALILSLALVISTAGCGKAAAETTNSSGTKTAATTAADSTIAIAAAGEIEMNMKEAINEDGIVMYHPVDWSQIFDFQSPIVYGTPKITKNDQEMSLYYMVVNGYLEIDSSEYAALTVDTVHEKAFTYITKGLLSNYVGDSLVGTETGSETVTVGGVDYLKVVGKSTEGYMQPNYIAYFGFYDNETLEMVHAPIAIVLFIASDDEKDISYGDDVLKACMATIAPFGA